MLRASVRATATRAAARLRRWSPRARSASQRDVDRAMTPGGVWTSPPRQWAWRSCGGCRRGRAHVLDPGRRLTRPRAPDSPTRRPSVDQPGHGPWAVLIAAGSAAGSGVAITLVDAPPRRHALGPGRLDGLAQARHHEPGVAPSAQSQQRLGRLVPGVQREAEVPQCTGRKAPAAEQVENLPSAFTPGRGGCGPTDGWNAPTSSITRSNGPGARGSSRTGRESGVAAEEHRAALAAQDQRRPQRRVAVAQPAPRKRCAATALR